MAFPLLRRAVLPQEVLLVCLIFLPYLTNGGKLSRVLGVVYPRLLESRSEDGNKVIRIAEDITLNLQKSSLLGKEFLLRAYQGDIMEHNYLDGQMLEENLYHDSRALASVIVSDDDGLKVEGIISPQQGIKPLSSREGMRPGNNPHVLFALAPETYQHDTNTSSRPVSSYISQRNSVPQGPLLNVTLELIIIVDSYFRKQFSTKDEMLQYLIISLNSVNLRYLTVSDPEVEIKLLAVEVCNHKLEEEFLVRSGKNRVDGLDTLLKLRRYVKWNQKKYQEYDAVYLITGLDMGFLGSRGWESGQLGIAFIGSVCATDKVGMGEDKARTFAGIRVMAHELGHILGCPHDGYQYTGYSSKACPWYDGFMMTYLSNSSNSMKFSKCCNAAMTRLARSGQGWCLTETNAQRRIKKLFYTSELPGKVLNRNEVCKLAFPDVEGIRFATDDGMARCYARCYAPGLNKTLRTLLPDHSRCNETSVEGIESRHKVCINGGCRTMRDRYPVEPVK
ncbi:venom metalloproteinase BumaMPs1-like [Dermacentor andersoni]|uniref:venom metalloproteinase BumaMPs1-like n=1 Tax=Dermacentor andersoni TaxID=34620 RepID=UPI002415AD3B|nr:venom metalloproteinase BumaMPs1-like [Dermacentor andersoni]